VACNSVENSSTSEAVVFWTKFVKDSLIDDDRAFRSLPLRRFVDSSFSAVVYVVPISASCDGVCLSLSSDMTEGQAKLEYCIRCVV